MARTGCEFFVVQTLLTWAIHGGVATPPGTPHVARGQAQREASRSVRHDTG